MTHVSGCFCVSDINILQGSVATHLRCGGIFYNNIARNCWWKNFENRSAFVKARGKNIVAPFFWHGVNTFLWSYVSYMSIMNLFLLVTAKLHWGGKVVNFLMLCSVQLIMLTVQSSSDFWWDSIPHCVMQHTRGHLSECIPAAHYSEINRLSLLASVHACKWSRLILTVEPAERQTYTVAQFYVNPPHCSCKVATLASSW